MSERAVIIRGIKDVDGRWIDRGPRLPAVVVPWCAEHDHQMDTYSGKNAWCCDAGMDDRCRLEQPARHYVIGEDR